ncbi:hypothetical protein ACIPSE_01235 [Streptomyces sp. NPDC090106]|uniref:hypothetical protein n=1 Tax=Streptomyces sp. NPDC090106 TaxID=3365946 RepID=UPI0038108982
MSTEVTVGMIGLGGALLGALGAVGGGWVQQWQQARTASNERRELRSYQAGDAGLLQLLHLVRELERAEMDNSVDYVKTIRDFGRDSEAALLRLPDAALRVRMGQIFNVLNSYRAVGDNEAVQIRWARLSANEGVWVLAAFLRGDPLPQSSEEFRRLAGSTTIYNTLYPAP